MGQHVVIGFPGSVRTATRRTETYDRANRTSLAMISLTTVTTLMSQANFRTFSPLFSTKDSVNYDF